MEDKLLIWRFKYGSRDALCRIYEKYEDDMLTLAISLLNETSTAEDVVHDVFVSFAESAEKLKLNGSLKGYLITCVANLARDKIRAIRRQPAELDEAELAGPAPNDPLQSIMCDEELQQLNYAMAQLPYTQREAIILHLRGGMTFKAIAKSQSVSINTIQSRYRYGLDKLRSLLDSEVEK